jgi:hypothetical protein
VVRGTHITWTVIYYIIKVRAVLYGCETWSLALTDEQIITVFEKGLLRRIFGHKNGENCIMVSFIIYTLQHVRGPFEKFVDSHHSDLKPCGGVVTVSFEVPPLASDALLTTFHPLLENVLQTVDHFEISCLGAPFSWLEKPRNRMGRDLN